MCRWMGRLKMPDELMESIEPYDFSEAVDFQTAYLAGYLADKYDVSAEDSVERANERVKNSTGGGVQGYLRGYLRLAPGEQFYPAEKRRGEVRALSGLVT